MLSLTALFFSMIKQVKAADPNVTFLDDDAITYKDLAHGAFELVTKEPVPRHIIVEDPGETIVLKKVGSTISVNQVTNTLARMEELQAAQQDALANLQGPHGSGTPPFVKSLPLQPINFIPPSAPAPQDLLQPLVFTPEPLIVLPPPTLITGAGPAELDTVVFDTFTAASGTFAASSTNSGKLTFGVAGASAGNTVLDGVTYDLSKTGPYGTLYVNSTSGAYTFVPDSAAINALTAPTTDGFVVTVSDGSTSASQTFTVILNGVNDAAFISGTTTGSVVEAGGTTNGAPGTPIATGTLTDTDVDNPPNTFTAVSSPRASAGGYGTFTMTAAGVWTYILDDTNAAVQALNAGDTLIDNFTVAAIDGTPQVVTITIHGASDAAIISGSTTGSVIEAGGVANATPGTATASGTLTDTDVDTTSNVFTAVGPTASAGGYGTFTMTAAGVWTYTLDNTNGAVQALNAGETLTDTFTVTTLDGTPQVVTITIHGTNDAAIVSGTTTGSVTEAGGVANAAPGTPAATGTLVAVDVDNTSNIFTTVSSPKTSVNGYGTFTMTAAGVWAYTLDNANAAVQALNVGDTLADSFTVTAIDGTPQLVTIAIHGTNDAAIISGTTTGSVIEAGTAAPGIPIATGTLTDTDVDNTPNTFTVVASPTASDGGYGTFTMTAAGVWTYTLDNNNSVVQALDPGDALTDTFTVTAIDGTTQSVAVTIHGASDADPNDFDNLATGSVVISDPPNVFGTPGSETIAGGGNAGQIIYAGAGSDTVNGTGKADILYGGSGNDTIKGNDGDDAIYGGSGNDTINGNNGSDTITGGFGADHLTGSNGSDRFVYLFAADSNAGQFDTITDFASGSDKIDLTALGGLGFVLLALSSSSTSVPAHTIAWLYDSAANETIVYVNPSDQTLHIGDSGLIEIHLQGIATIDASDFILAPAAAAVLAADSGPLDLSAATQSDATAVTITSSSDTTLSDGTLLADWNATDGSTDQASGVSASSDQFEWTEYPSFASSDGVQLRATEMTSSDAVTPSPTGLSTVLHDVTAPTATSFVFDHPTVPDSIDTTIGNNDVIAGSAPMPDVAFAALHDAAEQLARHGHTLESRDEDHGASAPESAHNAAHAHGGPDHSLSSEAAGQHDAPRHGPVGVDPPSTGHAAPGSAPAGSHQFGDSFYFKDGASHGQDSELSAELDDPSDPPGHHEHAGKVHESAAASMPELSPPHIDPAHGAGTTGAQVLHDLIV
ncbi:VCBS domain-containing protein [Bradyrhizobium sp. CCBAU 11386]|uniref:VCBS domain-containing protein n=1 Tax=Bradyrhizobium sp. CCBAU 11386 TaxID=1630837 RepID=UPI002302E1D4|nr:VCBS domain-containing protein [Bradyrhizobium sp. CCBAU 11386]